MKRIILTLMLALMAACAFAQLDREELERTRMRENHIKRCVQYNHKYKHGKPDKKGYKANETTFDQHGNPTMIINYRSNNRESSRLYYTYDDKGRRIEYRKEETMGGKKMKVSYKQQFTYDSNGNKKTETGFDGSSNYRTIYNYLPNGRLSDITRYNSDNTISERRIYTYDGNKQIIRVSSRNHSPFTIEKNFDKRGNLLSEITYDPSHNEQKKLEYTYDPAGHVETETRSLGGKMQYTLNYKFNRKGQLIQILQKRPGAKPFVNNNYTYDNDGNLITEEWADGNPDQISKKDSEFDHQGNIVSTDSYYAPYKFRVLYSYEYEKY